MTKKTPSNPTRETTRTLAELVTETGVSPGKFQQASKEGFIASNSKKQYPHIETLVGMVKFLATRADSLPVYDNIDQCSAATGIPPGVIKAMRKKSKDAFNNRGILLGPLLKQIFGSDDDTDWGEHKKKWDAIQSEVKGKEALGETLSKEAVGQSIRRGISGFFFQFDRIAEIELPPALKGRDEVGIRDGLIAAGKKLKSVVTAELNRYMEEKDKEE